MGVILMLMTIGGLIVAAVLLIVSRDEKNLAQAFCLGRADDLVCGLRLFIILRLVFQRGTNARLI